MERIEHRSVSSSQ